MTFGDFLQLHYDTAWWFMFWIIVAQASRK